MPGFESVFPPDDTGRVTFERYRYQAHLAFRFCLEAATDGDVDAVVCEHFEDIAVLRAGGWRLSQIKTRDPELGPWRLSDLLGRRGALRGLHRTYRALRDLSDGPECLLEARLEGAVARDDLLQRMRPLGDGPNQEIVNRCCDRLEIEEDEARAFLERVTVFDRESPRDLVRAANLDLLRRAAPGLSGAQVQEIYDRVFARIESAMEGDLLGDAFPAALIQAETATEAATALLAAKRLDRETLTGLFGPLDPPVGLLREIADSDALAASALEGKLRRAGALDDIVDDAKTLRANAAIREAEVLAGTLGDFGPALEDVRARLKVIANSVVAVTQTEPPAPAVWAAVMARLAAEGAAADPRRLFHSDQMLLLGELCQVSDLCEFGWGGDA